MSKQRQEERARQRPINKIERRTPDHLSERVRNCALCGERISPQAEYFIDPQGDADPFYYHVSCYEKSDRK